MRIDKVIYDEVENIFVVATVPGSNMPCCDGCVYRAAHGPSIQIVGTSCLSISCPGDIFFRYATVDEIIAFMNKAKACANESWVGWIDEPGKCASTSAPEPVIAAAVRKLQLKGGDNA